MESHFDVFISYARPDTSSVDALALLLREAGVHVWFDQWTLIPGETREEVVRLTASALRVSNAVAFFMGEGPLSREQEELLRSAQAYLGKREGPRRIIFVLLPGANAATLPTALAEYPRVRFSQVLTDASVFARLLAEIRGAIHFDPVVQEQVIADFLSMAGMPGEALPYHMKALRLAREIQDERPAGVIDALLRLGGVLLDLGFFDDAEGSAQEGLSLARQLSGKQPEETARALNLLGATYVRMGRLPDALNVLQKAFDIECKLLSKGTAPAHIASIINNIGCVLRDQGQFSQALTYFEQALKIARSTQELSKTSLANFLGNIGDVLHANGHYEEALEHFQQAIELDQAELGPNHPSISARLGSIGSVLCALGRPEEGILRLREALARDRLALGPEHPIIAMRLGNIGTALRDLGHTQEALEYLTKARDLSRRTLGPQHPSTAIIINNLGSIYFKQGQYEKALAAFHEVLEIQAAQATEDIDLGMTHHNIAQVFKAQGHEQEARKVNRLAYILLRFLEKNHPLVKRVSTGLDSVEDLSSP